MIKQFGLRDFLSVGKIQREGILLGLEEAFTRAYRPLLAALAAYFTANGMGTCTYVSVNDESGEVEGFVQVRLRRNRPEADVVFISPAFGDEDVGQVWLRLLKHVCQQVGEWGVQRVFARLPEGGPEMGPFRQAGFVVYTREDIFRLTPKQIGERLSHPELYPALRPESVMDNWALQQLYMAVAPRLVQQAESLADSVTDTQLLEWIGFGQREGYILEDQEEIIGYLQLWRGQVGHWLRIFLHPRAYDRVEQLIAHGLACWQRYPPRPLYCAVREYQGGLRGPLETFGFRFFATQAIVVKHTTVRVQERVPRLVPALEKRIGPTTPIVNSKHSPSSSTVRPR